MKKKIGIGVLVSLIVMGGLFIIGRPGLSAKATSEPALNEWEVKTAEKVERPRHSSITPNAHQEEVTQGVQGVQQLSTDSTNEEVTQEQEESYGGSGYCHGGEGRGRHMNSEERGAGHGGRHMNSNGHRRGMGQGRWTQE